MPKRLLSRLRQRRLWLAGTLAIVAFVMVTLAVWARTSGDEPPSFYGTALGGDPAPDFRLANQTGELVSLSEQRGKVVVLTFLYTHCPDVCPLTATWLRRVHEELGDAAEDVTFLAVSVDPEGDTPEAAYEFSERFGMLERWSYLIGTRAELEPIWQAYYIGVRPDPRRHDETIHNAPIYLIDRGGRLRALHTTGGETDSITGEVVHDIRALLAE